MSGGLDDVLVVIPCLNEAKNLPRILGQLVTQARIARIVVADGGSTDGSLEIVERFAREHAHVVLLNNPAKIQSAGVNLAVSKFSDGATWLVRVDGHCEYPDNYIERLLDAQRVHGTDSVVVPMVSRGEGCFQIGSAAAQNSILGTGGSAHRHLGKGRFVEHGHHALMPIEQFRAVGGYREDMSHNEDAELDLRLSKQGVRIWLEPEAALIYRPRGSPSSLWKQYFNYGRGRARTIGMHRVRPRLRQMMPVGVVIAGVLALAAPLNPIALVPIACWAVMALGGGLAIGVRERSVCAIAAGPAAMIMHVAWGCGFLGQVLATRAGKDLLTPSS